MKKLLLSLLFSAALCMGMPMMSAEAAEEQSGSFQLQVEEPLVEATYAEMQVMPTTEYNTENTILAQNAITLGENTYVFMQLKTDETTYPDTLLFDGDGTVLDAYRTIWNEDGYITVRFELPAYTGSKNLTAVIYDYDSEAGEYVYWAVDKETVTATPWNGAAEKMCWNAYTNISSSYTDVYMPASVTAKEFEVGLYDGNTKIGYGIMKYNYETNALYAGGLYPDFKRNCYIYSDEKIRVYYGAIYWGVNLTPNKKYALRANIDGVVYELGEALYDGTAYVTATSTSSMSNTQPVVYVNSYGYDINALDVRIVDESNGDVLATRANQQAISNSKTSGYIAMSSAYTMDQLREKYMNLEVLYQGETLYSSDYYLYREIVAAYYEHVQNLVVAKTYGIPEGTVVTATIDDEYEATATVQNAQLLLRFTKNGQPVALPVGSYTIRYKYTLNESDYSDSTYSLNVMGREEEEEDDGVYVKTVSRINGRYFQSGQNINIELTISKNQVETAEGNFVLKYEDPAFEEDQQIILTVTDTTYNNVDCWLMTGTIPAIAPTNSDIRLYRGNEYIYGTSIYVMDPTKTYARMYSVSVGSYNDPESAKGVEIYLPYFNSNWDKNLFNITLTDIVGNATTATYTREENGNYIIFLFDNVPANYLMLKASATYNGQPVVDIDNIESGKQLSMNRDLRNNYTVSRTTKTFDNGYSLTVGYLPSAPSIAYVVETSTMNIIKTWDFPEINNYIYLDENLLTGLNFDTAQTAYDVYFMAKDGSGYYSRTKQYFGIRKQAYKVENGIGMDSSGAYWLYKDGEVYTEYTGLYFWTERNAWVMISSGKVNFYYNGLVCYNDIWWYVSGGYIDFSFTGLGLLNDTWWYIKEGQIDFTYNGLVFFNGSWFYVVEGRVDFTYNGLAFVNDKWWYVVDGMIDFNYVGLAFVNNAWWYVEKGEINFNYNGLIFFNNDWWYVEGGCVNQGYTGLAFVNDKWWYVNQGRIDFSYSGLFFLNNEWWYVQSGEIDFAYMGLTYFNDIWWFVQDGKINFSYSGLAFVNDAWWYVQGGVIDFNYSGLAFYSEKWWYVERACVNFNYTGLCFFNNEWYYVANGEWVPTYNGTAVGPDGNTYNVVDGKVVF